jgi:hypothetical protein
MLETLEKKRMEEEKRDSCSWNGNSKGMSSYLTKKHGNVHEKGIVAITLKSMSSGSPADLADLKRRSFCCSNDDPGQWICWDFHEMRDILLRVDPELLPLHGYFKRIHGRFKRIAELV